MYLQEILYSSPGSIYHLVRPQTWRVLSVLVPVPQEEPTVKCVLWCVIVFHQLTEEPVEGKVALDGGGSVISMRKLPSAASSSSSPLCVWVGVTRQVSCSEFYASHLYIY